MFVRAHSHTPLPRDCVQRTRLGQLWSWIEYHLHTRERYGHNRTLDFVAVLWMCCAVVLLVPKRFHVSPAHNASVSCYYRIIPVATLKERKATFSARERALTRREAFDELSVVVCWHKHICRWKIPTMKLKKNAVTRTLWILKLRHFFHSISLCLMMETFYVVVVVIIIVVVEALETQRTLKSFN